LKDNRESIPLKAFSKDVLLHRSILREFGHELDAHSLILDFGCGSGALVQEYRDSGFQAFGADVILPEKHPFLKPIPKDSYRIPFDDNTFDLVFSNSVLEHVQDLTSALAEISRVLKPGGAGLHLFPPKARFVEGHLFVPLGGIIRTRPWLLLWAWLGIRNSFQTGLDYREVAKRNFVFLHESTYYRTKRKLREQIRARFETLVFADKEMIKHSYGRVAQLLPLVQVLPFLARVYGTFYNRCVFFEKPRAGTP
jgi:SAM-dependent methyltransferase